MKYKISVIMPVYNEQNYLRASIESILNQTFKDFEFIIIDDGSTDDSAKIIESYKDPRLIFYRSENKGMVHQFNFGINKARASIIARMDADDISELNRFEEQNKFLENHPEIHVVGSNVIFINENGKVISHKKYPENHNEIEFMMPIESGVCHPTVMILKEVFNQLGFYDESYGYAADHELFLKMISSGYRFHNIQEVLLKYRVRALRKDQSRVSNANALSYQIGVDYLNKIHSANLSNVKDFNYYYRMGLIEYYRGSITKSRKLFIKCIRFSKKKYFRITRYLLVSLLGDRIIHKLRETKILVRLSFLFNKLFKLDLHSFKNT
jgi:glycosyltransferase involved in cell wall biosynthesis